MTHRDSTAEEIVSLLKLEPHHLEGGFFLETYRSTRMIPSINGDRACSTAIYYLLTDQTVSRMHRLPFDEMFHFYFGDPVEMLLLMPDGDGRVGLLGTDLSRGQRPQQLVPARTWQGSRLCPGGRFALLGTTMSPGFDGSDFETGDREKLCASYPAFGERIEALTPGG